MYVDLEDTKDTAISRWIFNLHTSQYEYKFIFKPYMSTITLASNFGRQNCPTEIF